MDGDSKEDGGTTAPELVRELENEIDDPELEEIKALGRIAHAFRGYKTDAEWEIRRWEYNYSRYILDLQNTRSHDHCPLLNLWCLVNSPILPIFLQATSCPPGAPLAHSSKSSCRSTMRLSKPPLFKVYARVVRTGHCPRTPLLCFLCS